MFNEDRDYSAFDWAMLGDIAKGRPNLGQGMDVVVYRLMQFTLRDALIAEFDPGTADRIFFKAGEEAGKQFCRRLLDATRDFNGFIQQLTETLQALKIGILRVERAEPELGLFTLTIAEDLDCSGLPVTGETICTYDEGFIKGVLREYTGKDFSVREVDCWCSGDRVCRFDVRPAGA
ncbi:MAG: 4-vinyl reductase [Spirochaetes bacterium]|nr:4-vinyl reductase [Spirochaetota bacterium]MBU1081560.1 4-vinyl reductase [Spirochaetota bacterium]